MTKCISYLVSAMMMLSALFGMPVLAQEEDAPPEAPSLDESDCTIRILEKEKGYYLGYREDAFGDEDLPSEFYLVWKSVNGKSATIYETYTYEDSETAEQIAIFYANSNFAYPEQEAALIKYQNNNPYITVIGDDIKIGLFGLYDELYDIVETVDEDGTVHQEYLYQYVLKPLDIDEVYDIEEIEPDIPHEIALQAGQTMTIEKNTTVNPDNRVERVTGFPEVAVSPLSIGTHGTVNGKEITDETDEVFNQLDSASFTILEKGDKAEIVCDAGSLLVSLSSINFPHYDITYPFEDVPETMWYHSVVYEASRAGLMTGTDATHFEPNSPMTRGMVATVLYRMAGEPEVSGSSGFSDVPDGIYYSDPIAWAVQAGVVTGYTTGDKAGTFGPNDNVTREQLCTMAYRYLDKVAGKDTSDQADLDGFNDKDQVSDYAVDAVKYCVAKGIISGAENGTMLYPLNNATRAECAKILLNTSKVE